MSQRQRVVLGLVAIAAGAAVAAATLERHGQTAAQAPAGQQMMAAEAGTSRADLERLTQELEAHLAARPADGAIAAQLADVLLRRARVEVNGGYLAHADRMLSEVLRQEPNDYNALRAIGVVRLSQHRFREAIEVAQRASRIRPKDAWNFGVLGDAYLELGDYEQGFDALDTMVSLRPDAAAYARVAYAHELQGRLPDAVRAMTMASSATGARDVESQAWHRAQLGFLYLQMGQLADAERELNHAMFLFPGHPYARVGRARLAVAQGNLDDAVTQYLSIIADAPAADVVLAAAELLHSMGRTAEAEAMFARAEALERESWLTETTQPANLARILAQQGSRVIEAVELAETAAHSRSDIFTMDALAWAYYRAGRLSEAREASLQARRTGTRDPRILAHAAAIDAAIAE